MPGGSMPNKLERFLNMYGEFILGLAFSLTGIMGIAIISFGYVNRISKIIGLQGPTISVPHSLAFLAIMAVFTIIGFALLIDDLAKAI
jgi:hypothetical protein